MSVWIDTKYLNTISYRLDRWVEKKISPHQSICRCPICGDSEKKINKKRGYFYEKGDMLLYRCFNCEASMSFGKFLKDFDPFVYKQYALESYKDRTHYIEPEKVDISKFIPKYKPTKKVPSILDDTKQILNLDKSNKAFTYLVNRKIPDKYFPMFYLAENFFNWASKNTDKFTSGEELSYKDHPRIVLPWYNAKGDIFAYQARSIYGQEPKYYTIILDEDQPKLFTKEVLDTSKKIYVVEGPIDSIFLPNSVAVGSSALTSFDDTDLDVTYVYDNENRNVDINNLMHKAIVAGKRLFIPPKGYDSKDINDAILDGYSLNDIVELIDTNSWKGASALLKFNQWKRS